MNKLFATALLLFPAVAMAHVGDHSLINSKAGFLHPLTGLDHLLALVATGLWLAQSEIRGKPGFVAGFVAVLAVAIAVGTQFTQVTFEAGLVATLVVLGALMACAVRGSLVLHALVIGATAAVHGFVHGTELPGGEGALPFAAALVVSSALVISAAMLAGQRSQKIAKGLIARVAGAAFILFGFGMAF